jgi:hypothetical protein
MFIEAKLILQHYIPERITKDMWFLGMNRNFLLYFKLLIFQGSDEQQKLFIELNGYPVQPFIYLLEVIPNLSDDDLLCLPDEIGWFDEGDHSD